MRILPRFHLPRVKAVRRLWRKTKGHLRLRRIYYSLEFILLIGVYFALLGLRSHTIFSALLIAAFIVVHSIAHRRLLPRIESRFAPAPYDERKIFFDLGQGLRNVATIDHLYQQLAERLRVALDASNAGIFVRDEASGNFHLRVVAAPGRTAETELGSRRLQLSKRASVVRRLVNL